MSWPSTSAAGSSSYSSPLHPKLSQFVSPALSPTFLPCVDLLLSITSPTSMAPAAASTQSGRCPLPQLKVRRLDLVMSFDLRSHAHAVAELTCCFTRQPPPNPPSMTNRTAADVRFSLFDAITGFVCQMRLKLPAAGAVVPGLQDDSCDV